ncbi:hypothetical protein [Rhodospirillum sp. A1_3_36]|uniref:cell division protein FtsL n=1 Tax=Rhodospirillum sp. A1_3_36 TaxID=3391666 RepID=UPI0039A7516D
MIRPIHLIWAVLVMGIGTALFLVAYEVEDREEELLALRHEIRETSESIHVLRAEWSYLNDPTRLERLADEHLGLAPIKPEQFTTIAQLTDRPAPPAPWESNPEGGVDPNRPPATGDIPLAKNKEKNAPQAHDKGQTGTAGAKVATATPLPSPRPKPPVSQLAPQPLSREDHLQALPASAGVGDLNAARAPLAESPLGSFDRNRQMNTPSLGGLR